MGTYRSCLSQTVSDRSTPFARSLSAVRLLLVLRPFTPCRVSSAFFITTASADFSCPLRLETSPGKVHEHSARAVRLYQMRLSVTLGFRVLSHAHRPHQGLSACSSSYGRAFATDFFHAENLAVHALSFATVIFTVPGHLFSYDLFMPMPGARVSA